MYNIWDFLKTFWDDFCDRLVGYVSALSFYELLAVSFFLGLLFLVVCVIVFCVVSKKSAPKQKDLLPSQDEQNVLGDVEPKDDELPEEDAAEQALDWSPVLSKTEKLTAMPTDEVMQYRLKPHNLKSLLGLIIDLLSREVEDAKLAQVIMHKNQHLSSEDDVIYTIYAIKMFVKMAKSGMFKKIDTNKILPNEVVAVFNLAHGDCSLVLILLDAFIDDALNKLKRIDDEKDKQKRCYEIANVCICFGTFALFTDASLASGAFELAIELNPQNALAWGRLGDAYRKMQNMDKAVWAYMNVLNLGDERVYTQQKANAEKMLSSYYRENGKKEQASKMVVNSEVFYDKCGINMPLSERECRIIYIIETNEKDNMGAIVEKLLMPK